MAVVDLEKIVFQQAERYVALGFHSEVYPELVEEKARRKYQDDFILPEGAVQPREYRGR